ncbi:glycosyltransferase family 4 protein [Novosphingobium sp.]|uniref:glycosyltransferase family 4 protein n=1 Tax=Novosphingobium sp. TaxID=1874826 RepID=UPI00273572F0|nr:glycosyltransferase family 4 protein [Novosphingobium sp.]MDP3906647.1 glycosyltransferase family 4 protein [Novosphingobium sp.]
MQVAVFHPGTQHSWQTAYALQQLEKLEWYATSIFYKPDNFPYNLEKVLPSAISVRLHKEFRRFQHAGLNPDLVKTVGLIEWFERLASRAGFRKFARKIDAFGNKRFVDQIADEIRSEREFALWGYNGSSLSSFELASSLGRKCILDRTNGDFSVYNKMMLDVQEQYGNWFLPIEREVPQSTIESDWKEYRAADKILVGSEFAKRTIESSAADESTHKKLQVLNYCYDENLFRNMPVPQPVRRDKPVKFLFLGLVIPRKGIHHVLEAISRIPQSAAELTIVGDLKLPREAFAPYADRVNYIPTVARADVPSIMAAHDVLLLPSYFEGAGIVLYEALAAGCGLIQSDRCALAVTDQTGILLDQLDTESVYAAMMAAIDDRDRLDGWRQSAQAEAANYTFDKYRDGIAAVLSGMGL